MPAQEPKLDKEISHQLKEFKESVATTAEDIVFKVFPVKILELTKLVESTSSSDSPFNLSHIASLTDPTVYPPPVPGDSVEPDAKKRKRTGDNGVASASGTASSDIENARFPNLMLANKHNQKLHEIVKKECGQLVDLCDKVKLWVNLTMPKIEDGDNFGVQIQEEALGELHRAQESALNLRDHARLNHLNRAKICSKLIKYPHIEDYAAALKEHDEKIFIQARQHLSDLRNIYAVISDLLIKNITKIRAPKGNNSTAMY